MEALQQVRFGDVAVRCGFITPEGVAGCVKLQDRMRDRLGTPARLGEIMVEKGYLKPSQVASVLQVQQFTSVRNDSMRYIRDWLVKFPHRRAQADTALLQQSRLFKEKREIRHVSELLEGTSRWSLGDLASRISDRLRRPSS
ncbi:MAG: hypothetical protein HY722_05500 [Planctomycetes bacterium]|nr:hypothetical protein [Planctomycetota bacterium]